MKQEKGFMVPLVIAIIAVIAVGIGFYLNKSGEDAMMEKDDGMMEQSTTTEESMMEDDDSMMMESKAGAYLPYSEDKLAMADSGDVILFFRASWCPTCRALDADIKANLGNIPEGVTILDVDYDKSTALKAKYGVTYQHTFVQVDSSGKMLTKWSGSPTLAEFVTHIK